jgi:hypothetical protein
MERAIKLYNKKENINDIKLWETKNKLSTIKETIFQLFVEKKIKLDTLIYEDAHIMVFLPAGRYNDTTPLNRNPTSIHKAGGSAIMSHIHILIIPKKRIYNAVTLNTSHIKLLEHIKIISTKIVSAMLTADSFSETGEIIPLSKPFGVKNINALQLGYTKYIPGGMDLDINTAKKFIKSIKHSVHIYPNHSVPYLHIHCYISDLKTRNGKLIDHKNYPLNKVIEYIG